MMRKTIALLLTALLAAGAFAQNPTQPQPVTATTVSLPMLNPPIPPGGVTVQLTGTPGPSSSTVYYWLVSNFAIGNSTPSGPFPGYNLPTTLSGGNFSTVSWRTVANAVSYDLLKTTTAAPPTGACNCAVATAISGSSQTDQSNSTNSYTVTTFDPNTVAVQLDNEGLGGAGQASLTARQNGNLLGITDGQFDVLPGDCFMFTTAGAFTTNSGGAGTITGPAMVRIAANNWVLQGITTAATNSIALECDVSLPARLTTGRGIKVTGFQLFYGVQTTALTSITAPTLSTLTYPATGAAAGVTSASAGGSLTVTPGTLQLATTTSGQCYSENISLGTPVFLTTANQRLTIEQIFNQTAAAATQLQFCGAIVLYTNVPL